MFAWDVRMDWKLGDISSLGLRERRMFQYRAVYYAAICIDLVLRFGWTATLVPGGISSLPTEGVLQQACALID